VGRELTKVHEEILRGLASKVIDELKEPIGEFTVVTYIGQTTDHAEVDALTDEQVLIEFGETTNNTAMSRRRAIALLATKHRMTPNNVYAAIERAKKLVK
jgi:16S rRNA C1402 (ribose-2'-O) methylase RsmI